MRAREGRAFEIGFSSLESGRLLGKSVPLLADDSQGIRFSWSDLCGL